MRACLSLAAMLVCLAPGPASAQAALPTQPAGVAIDAKAAGDLAATIVTERQIARYPEARALATRAFEGGEAEAGNLLSMMFHLGLGGPADPKRAMAVRAAAAEAGSVGANMTLAEAHRTGGGPYRKDAKAAFRYMSAAARTEAARGKGEAVAGYRLAMMLREGIGTRKDLAASYAWVVRASETGHGDAMISRAVMLATGEGVATDAAAARRWYEAAAAVPGSNHAHALRGLGGMLAFGQGGPVDLPRATAYLAISKVRGDPYAGALLDAVRPRLDDSMRKEADRIMRQWLADENKPRKGGAST